MNTSPLIPAARLAGLRPYEPPRPRWRIDLPLDANEGPRPSPALLEILRAPEPDLLRRYPRAEELESRLADMWRIEPQRVVVTNGADEAIDRLSRSMLEPGRSLLIHSPTFEMIERAARLAGGNVRSIPWRDGAFPALAFVDALGPAMALVALVTPNNPTGLAIPADDILTIAAAAERTGSLVMVDLAYAEFADEDPTPKLLDRPNIVVLRTFSKALGLAGLRVGYAIAPEGVALWLRAAGGPYPVASVSLLLAQRAVSDLPASIGPSISLARQERSRISTLVADLGAEPLLSQANFVAFRSPRAPFIHDALASVGISVRGFGSRPGLEDLLRVTLPLCEVDCLRLERSLRAATRPEAILFDLDGVLADVSASYRSAIMATARTFGVTITPADIARAKHAGDANNDWILTRRLIAERTCDAPSLETVVERFQSLYLGSGGSPGLRETETLIPPQALLTRLASRCTLAVVTGRPRDEARWFLERSRLSGLMSAVVTMDDAPAKPSPEPVLLAMRRLGVRTAWMIGDTPDDLRAARASCAAGVDVNAGEEAPVTVVPIGIAAPGEEPSTAGLALEQSGAARVLRTLLELESLLP